MSMLTGVAAGVSLEAAVSHGMVGLARRPRDGTRLAFAAAAVAAAVMAIAVVAMYSASSAEAHAALMKWLLYPASTAWTVAVVWLVFFVTGLRARRFLLGLTAAFAVTLVVDLVLPLGLLHDDVGRLTPMEIGGAHAVDVTDVSPHPLHAVTVVLTALALGCLLWALVSVSRRGLRREAVYLGLAVALFAASMLVDLLTDYGVITSFYTAPLFFAGVVLVTSVMLRRESLRAEAELRRYRTELESLVEARVADLDWANASLAEENRVRLAAEAELRRRIAELDALQHLSQTLASRTDLTAVLEQAGGEIAALLHAASARICLAAEAAAGGAADGAPSAAPPAAAPACVAAGPDGTPLPADLAEVVTRCVAGDVLVVPLVARGEVLGVLDVVRADDDAPFGEAEAGVAQTVADSLAAVVENERLHERARAEAAVRERQRLARELHDAVTQTIYSATLIAEALPSVWERDPDEGRRSLETMRLLVQGALAEMRTLLFELRPEALVAAPASMLLERLGVALAGQIQVPVEVDVREEAPLPEDVKVVLYRVAQEALSNVGKHARASRVGVALQVDARGAALVVEDDGCGFDPGGVPPEKMGLRIMDERLHQVGASVTVESVPGEGTRVEAWWPRTPAEATVVTAGGDS